MEGLIRPSRTITIAPVVMLFLISFVLISFGYQNGIYLFLCFFTICLILKLIWRVNLPGILPFAFLMQWLQVIAFVVWMNIYDKPIDYLTKSASVAMISACIGLFVMAAIIVLGIRNLPVYSDQEFSEVANKVNPRKILILYVVSTLFLSSIGFAFGNTSGFAQILVNVATLKWVFFMFYGYIAWINKRNRSIILIILVYEFTIGLYSFFSSFKEVLFYAILASLTFIRHITLRQFLTFLLAGFFLVAIFFTWTAIKGSYRNYLNQGKRQQVVEVSQSDAISKIGENVSNLSWKKYQAATSASFYRLQYIYHLSIVMDRIPTLAPHEDGKIWWQNISFALTPRILFPNKPIYEASAKTNKYTGLRYSGLKNGASFSLGYYADSYVDFGYVGMYFPLILIALFVVLIYRTFYKMHQLNLFFRFAIINVILYNFISFEADGLILFGRLFTNFIVYLFLSKTVFPSIQNWLNKS